MNGFQKEIDELEGKKGKLTQNMMKGFHSFEDITTEIEEKKQQMERERIMRKIQIETASRSSPSENSNVSNMDQSKFAQSK